MSTARVTAKTCKVCGESKPKDQFPQYGPFARRCLECADKAATPSSLAEKSRKQRARAKEAAAAAAPLGMTVFADPLLKTDYVKMATNVKWVELQPPPPFDDLLVELKSLRTERDALRDLVNRLYADLQAIVK